jgi:hypothetical protein
MLPLLGAEPASPSLCLPILPMSVFQLRFVVLNTCMLQEHHQGNHSLVIEDNVEMNNVVYMFNCHDSTLTVKGKLNSVFLDSCRKSSVVFDSLVSSVEFVNCQSVQMQVRLMHLHACTYLL